MIDVRISRSGLERFDSNGTPAEIVLEFGYLINQYCSAIKNAARRPSPACKRLSRTLQSRAARFGNWTRAWRGSS